MKTNIFTIALIVLLGIFKNSYAQEATYTLTVKDGEKKKTELPLYNLFYLSKFMNEPIKDYNQQLLIYNSLNYLVGKEKIDGVKIQNPVKDSLIYNFLKEVENYKESQRGYFIKLFENGSFKIIEKEWEQYLDKHKDFFNANFPKKYNQHILIIKKKDSLQEKINQLTEIKNQKRVKLTEDSILYYQYESFLNNIDSSILVIEQGQKIIDSVKINTQINRLKTENESKTTSYLRDVENMVGNYIKWKFSSTDKNGIIDYNFQEKNNPQTQIQINSIVQAAQLENASSSISLPSESQIIEAMAIFLANRARQEAVIWFMDQVRSQMNNPMIEDVFPETIKMIEGLESYKVPNFSTSWRYAISKDFVNLPKNLAGSTWVKEFIINDPEKANQLEQSISFGYELNSMMAGQYNYRDIIKYFYLNPRTETGNENYKINKLINNSINSLYIITNEFFAVDKIDGKNTFRLLSYEEINSLDNTQYNTLLELFELKYGDKINKMADLKIRQKEDVKKWIGNLLISLGQFDKIRNNLKSDQKTDDVSLNNKNLYSVWKILHQITKNLNFQGIIVPGSDLDKNLSYIESSLKIYENLQSSDYSSAAKQTFELIEKINFYSFPNNSVEIDKSDSPIYKLFIKDKKSIDLMKGKQENTFILKSYNEKSLYFKFIDKNILLSTNSELKDSLELINIKNLMLATKYLNKKNDTYNLIKDLIGGQDKKNESFKKLKELSQTIKLDEIQLLQILYYVHSQENKNPKEYSDPEKLLKNFFKIEHVVGSEKTNYLDITRKYDQKYTKQLLKLLSFFGDVLTVENEKELADVIDSHVLPPTSYKLKRKKSWSIDLNAYVGAYGGFLDARSTSSYESKYIYGITAPIGFAFTKSTNLWIDNLGFTIDMVDLGNIVNHYLISPKTDYGKEVHFSEVFSPGFTLMGGIRNTPFFIYGGIKLQPLKSYQSEDGNLYNDKTFDNTIFHVGLKLDIPLINFTSKD